MYAQEYFECMKTYFYCIPRVYELCYNLVVALNENIEQLKQIIHTDNL